MYAAQQLRHQRREDQEVRHRIYLHDRVRPAKVPDRQGARRQQEEAAIAKGLAGHAGSAPAHRETGDLHAVDD
jgi:hypothetical protein